MSELVLYLDIYPGMDLKYAMATTNPSIKSKGFKRRLIQNDEKRTRTQDPR